MTLYHCLSNFRLRRIEQIVDVYKNRREIASWKEAENGSPLFDLQTSFALPMFLIVLPSYVPLENSYMQNAPGRTLSLPTSGVISHLCLGFNRYLQSGLFRDHQLQLY